MIRDFEEVNAVGGKIIKIWPAGDTLSRVAEVYENHIWPNSQKGVNMHFKADLLLVLQEGQCEVRTYSRKDLELISNEQMGPSRQAVMIRAGTPFSIHNSPKSVAVFLVLSSEPHSKQDLVKFAIPGMKSR
mgnify:CR=1 FL=1